MTKEDWEASNSASDMLRFLHLKHPNYLKALIPDLHRYFIACCWKIKHLIPQKHLRNGLRGAEKWIAGEIDDEELYRLNWYAEAECFALDYAKTQEDVEEIQTLINGIDGLKGMEFEDARQLLKKAAYFAEISMVYPKINHAPYVKSMCKSQFVCADLLREHISPDETIFNQ